MVDSVWMIHEILSRVNDTRHTHGADRADLVRDLGFSRDLEFSRFDIIDSFLAWLPITLASEDSTDLESVYLVSASSRSTAESLEYVIYPNTMSLEDAELLISPRKV